MKKRIMRIFCFALLTLAFIMSGCGPAGEQKISVNVEGNYTASSQEAMTTYVNQVNENDKMENSGYRFSMEFNTVEQTTGLSLKTISNGRYTIDSENNMKAILDTKVISTDVSNRKTEIHSVSYVNDGYYYFELEGEKVKVDMTKYSGGTELSALTQYTPNVEFIDKMIKDMSSVAEIEYSVATEGNIIKYCFKTENATANEMTSSVTIYLVFENDVFTSMKMIQSTTMTVGTIDMTIDFESYNGNIKMPNFDDYVEQ